MTKYLIPAALVASALVPAAASAQALPAAIVAVVDLEKVTAECNACKTATAALRSQATAAQNREKTLSQQLETEGKGLQAEVDALKGAEPSAALKTKIQAFQTKQQNGVQELQRAQTSLQRNQAYIQQQIATKLGPIYQQVMQRRGANIMMETGTTLATGSAIDVTPEVLAALNTAMPSIATQAPAQAQQTPQGR